MCIDRAVVNKNGRINLYGKSNLGYFLFFCFFETGLLYIALAVLELTL